MRRSLLTTLALVAAAAAACDSPETDRESRGGPDVSGVIEGTVFYVGPRPECDYVDEQATRVRGRVVLLAFLSDDPPPPSGGATSAENLLIVPGTELFGLADCLPEEPTAAERADPVTRSAAFTWPDVTLAAEPGASVDYQVRGFYDHDEDFNPFFSVRRLATKGDVAGGAFADLSETPPQFERLRFGSVADHPDGQVLAGVAVSLAAYVNTELPAFELGDGTTALSSEATVPAVADPLEREERLWQLTSMQLSLIEPRELSWARTLLAAGMEIDPHPSGYGWFTLPVDADRDGEQDPHPILGASGIAWEHPIVILRRARNLFEQAVGVPDVVIVATTRPSQTLRKDTFDPHIQIAVPPIAAVDLLPGNPACTVPYIAPGNLAETYERIPVDCQEVPTGNYDVNALSGIAGGTAVNYRALIAEDMPELPPRVLDTVVRLRTDNDWIIEGGQFSSQAWSIPNELGCPDPYRPNAFDEDGRPVTISQLDPDPRTACGDPRGPCDDSETLMQCSQGPAGRFSVVDPDPSNAPVTPDSSDGHGVASCQTTIRATTMMPDAVQYMPVPEACCEGVRHLCGLPLCPLRDAAALPSEDGTAAIREMLVEGMDFTRGEDGTITPVCVPFLMPASCCP